MLTKEIIEARRMGIGGSDAAAICGLSTFRTPYQIYLEKICQTIEEKKDVKSLQRIMWGHFLESIISDHFASRNKVTLIKKDMTWHPEHEFMFANTDRFIVEWNAILEIKTVDKFACEFWGEEGTDQIPEQYLVQCAHYASVMNVDKVYLAALIGGNDYREYLYERNLQLEEALIQKEKYFWQEHVQKLNPPPASYPSEAAFKYSSVEPEKVEVANSETLAAVKNLLTLKESLRKLNSQEEEIKTKLMEKMKDAEKLIDEAGSTLITWKKTKTSRQFRLARGE